MSRQFDRVDFNLELMSKEFDEKESFAYWIFSARVWLAEQYLMRAAGVPRPQVTPLMAQAPHPRQTSIHQ